MNIPRIVKVTLVILGLAAAITGGRLALRTYITLLEEDHKADVQKYAVDFQKVKSGGLDVLDEHSKISNLRTAIKLGFLKSAEIGTNDIEIFFLHALSKERARKELEKRMKEYRSDPVSLKAYQWLLDNLDDPDPNKINKPTSSKA